MAVLLRSPSPSGGAAASEADGPAELDIVGLEPLGQVAGDGRHAAWTPASGSNFTAMPDLVPGSSPTFAGRSGQQAGSRPPAAAPDSKLFAALARHSLARLPPGAPPRQVASVISTTASSLARVGLFNELVFRKVAAQAQQVSGAMQVSGSPGGCRGRSLQRCSSSRQRT